MSIIESNIVALLRNTSQIYVGESRFTGKQVFLVESKSEGYVYELRGDANTSDHYAALVNEFGAEVSKPDSPLAELNAIEFNTGRQYTSEGQVVEAWVVAIDLTIPEIPFKIVYFNDKSRMISGYVRVRALSEKEVMEAYDRGHYDQG